MLTLTNKDVNMSGIISFNCKIRDAEQWGFVEVWDDPDEGGLTHVVEMTDAESSR